MFNLPNLQFQIFNIFEDADLEVDKNLHESL